jgi:hypothetical protein
MLAILQVASFWRHHFHVAAVCFAITALSTVVFLAAQRRVPRIVGGGLLMLAVLLMFASPRLTGGFTLQKADLRPVDICDVLAGDEKRDGPRTECLILEEQWPAGSRFATVQQNPPGTLAAWTPSSIRLGCRAYFQFPWLGQALLDEFLRCLEGGEIDLVFRAPYWAAMSGFEERLGMLLERQFRLRGQFGDIEVWERR